MPQKCDTKFFEFYPRKVLIHCLNGYGILASNRELDFCLLPGSHANVMTFPQGSTENIWVLGSALSSPCRFDHNLWQMVNTAEAIRKSLSSLMEERVSALINIRPCSTFSHCKSSLVDLERVSTPRLSRYATNIVSAKRATDWCATVVVLPKELSQPSKKGAGGHAFKRLLTRLPHTH